MSRPSSAPLHRLRRRLARFLEDDLAAAGIAGRGALRVAEHLAALPVFGAYFHHAAGILHAAMGHHDQAIVHQEKALAAGGSIHQAAIHYRLGQARLHNHDFGGAEASFRAAVRRDPMARVAWLALVDSMMLQGRHVEAVDELVNAAAAVPANSSSLAVPLPHYLTTPALATEERVRTLRDIVERHPTAEEAMIFLSMLENHLGHHEAGTANLRRAAALHWSAKGVPSAAASLASGAPPGGDSKSPSFMIIGQAKAATSTLFQVLSALPSIDPPLIKEPQFWSYRFDWGEAWYRAVFPPHWHRPGTMTFEASTNYFTHPQAAPRIAVSMPRIKFIALLREPVSRAYAHYQMDVRMGMEQRPWEAIVDQEIESLGACPLDVAELERVENGASYLLRSAALPHLQRWLALFAREQLLVLRTRELADDLPTALRRICTFLGLPAALPSDLRRVNEGRYPPMAPAVEQRLRAWFAAHERALASFLADLGVPSR